VRHRIALGVLVALTALTFTAVASAHARLSPPVAVAKELQLFTLAVPTEKANAQTTSIELTLPVGFSIDSFVPAAGWKRNVQTTGSGDAAVIQKVTWTGGSVPTGEDSAFSFLAIAAAASKTYTFSVRQTYSDGSVVDWAGPESADAPAPTVKAVSSFGGGTSTLSIVALALAAIALIVSLVGLFARGGRTLA
jgi:uncharacterized protein YcnI